MRIIRKNITCFFKFIVILGILVSCSKKEEDENFSQLIISPGPEEAWLAGNTYAITWKDDISNELRLKLYKGNEKLLDIEQSIINNGSFNWTIPDSLQHGNDYYIKIFSNDDDFVYYQNLKPFTIVPQVDTSTFIDERDGRSYKIVKIGEQWWFAENFNYSIESSSICYNDDPDYCIENGRLYSVNEAIQLSPPGWHLPDDMEWRKLEYYLGINSDYLGNEGGRGYNAGDLLKENGGLEFNAKLSGFQFTRWNGELRYSGINYYGRYWTSSPKIGVAANYWYRSFSRNAAGVYRYNLNAFYYRMSVRYVKDEN